MYRQGDLLLVRVDRVPGTARPVGNCVLAVGEATGHSHRLEKGAQQYLRPNGERYVRVVESAVDLVHEEHAPIRLPGPAVYRVIRQREYVPPDPETVRLWRSTFFRVVGD